jgi:hypothetical protein
MPVVAPMQGAAALLFHKCSRRRSDVLRDATWRLCDTGARSPVPFAASDGPATYIGALVPLLSAAPRRLPDWRASCIPQRREQQGEVRASASGSHSRCAHHNRLRELHNGERHSANNREVRGLGQRHVGVVRVERRHGRAHCQRGTRVHMDGGVTRCLDSDHLRCRGTG